MGANDKGTRLGYTEKAQAIVNKLTLEEKVFFMSGQVSMEELLTHLLVAHYNHVPYPAGGNARLNVPAMKFVDGPRGVVAGNDSTCFPVSMGRGATFDPELEERIGQAIGKEVRARGGNLFGGVCINLPRHPGWGRSQETYGEESFHLGVMGAALVRGVQSQDVIACVKHFAFNSMENARFNVNVVADKRTEREVYLPHFKACIDAGAASVMSAYNMYQGSHCGHSDYLLNHVLKHEWDFDGFVISDFMWGIHDTVEAANGGMDIEMCNTVHFGESLVKAVNDGRVSEGSIDAAALRIIRTLLAFTETHQSDVSETTASQDHIALALEAAEKSMTLIKNDNSVLPFSKTVKKVAVIGKLANEANIGDYGSSRVFPPYVVTPLVGIRRLLPEAEVTYDDASDLQRAANLAKSSDVVVFVVGYSHNDEGEYITNDGDNGLLETMESVVQQNPELLPQFQSFMRDADEGALGGDRMSLGLHDRDVQLLNEVGPLNPRSAVVLIGGNTIVIEDWKASVASILMAYYPGMEGGTAIAKTLFGDVNPGGKLPYVIPTDERHLPEVDWNASKITYGYYHGYTKLEKENITPSLPYGFGLSYTTFRMFDPTFCVRDDCIVACCKVENTGQFKGDEVVQMYVGYRQSTIDRPVKVLRGFQRITLAPGETKIAELVCPLEKIQWYNAVTGQWELEAMAYEVYIGNSSAREDLLEGKILIS